MKRVLALAIAVVALSPATASAQGPRPGCQFALTRLDHTTTNVLALDTNACYWSTHYVAVHSVLGAGLAGLRAELDPGSSCTSLSASIGRPAGSYAFQEM